MNLLTNRSDQLFLMAQVLTIAESFSKHGTMNKFLKFLPVEVTIIVIFLLYFSMAELAKDIALIGAGLKEVEKVCIMKRLIYSKQILESKGLGSMGLKLYSFKL